MNEFVDRLDTHQKQAVDDIAEAVRQGARLQALQGGAGTGKTTVLKALVNQLDGCVLAAPTNRAAMIISSKTDRDAHSVHSACMTPIYAPEYHALQNWYMTTFEDIPQCVTDRWPDVDFDLYDGLEDALRNMGISPMDLVLRWDAKPEEQGTLIIDEASMLGGEQLELAAKVFSQIVLVGDPNQLPPVKDAQQLTKVDPRYVHRLETVYRQKQDSPVLDVAYTALATGEITADVREIGLDEIEDGTPIIVWRNSTRDAVTAQIRELRGFCKYVRVGEPLICTNATPKAKAAGFVRNSLWRIVEIEGSFAVMTDGERLVKLKPAFEHLAGSGDAYFRFGYCLTAHTAQGGEWPKVAIHAGDARAIANAKYASPKQWAYTAVTRASSEVFLMEGINV